MSILFDGLSDAAHMWLYAADRHLTEDEIQALAHHMDALCATWTSHGRRVESRWDLLDRRLLCLAAEVPAADLSGCGIDTSRRALDAFASENGFAWVDGLAIIYRNADGTLCTADRPAFRTLARTGEVTDRTLVIDAAVRDLGAARRSGIERPARDSWHARLLPVPA